MSDSLAISSAFSVFMMAAYVLLGGDAAQVGLDGQAPAVLHFSVPTLVAHISALFSN